MSTQQAKEEKSRLKSERQNKIKQIESYLAKFNIHANATSKDAHSSKKSSSPKSLNEREAINTLRKQKSVINNELQSGLR